ncbi:MULTISPECIES: VanZ family protein [Psychrilyobacter]|uniref:VanZ family protein n=1 Tax=Psychrilyobacter piezotolerans TaxID=2293438 RepID=A0ABX9KF19_9FUSO|nr:MULTISPECIES: VanZ family protein [Psychrilyobacter]MCS5423161.1 VanZ family protein [Psychrilyobacter sp. S5]NDI78559.1 VanZ family protein [Psychrilyobacter piezotolerans]RDE60264.1 VanZ family protein [Psychrilyobacter sp. S5]REI40372.1 VanZ family protein [Psychrilyobacter piezotolerans]
MKIFFKLLSILIMISIIYFSSQPIDISLKQSQFVRDLIGINFQSMGIDFRKLAHLGIYMFLGFSVVLSFSIVDRKTLLLVFLGIFIFACIDELHQTFIPGRGGQFSDVLIDCAGGIIGMIFGRKLQIKSHKDS